MDVVAAIKSKGGVGGTSLLFALGIEAAKTKTVFFIDLDPQGSLTRLCERRDKHQPQLGLISEQPMLLQGVKNIQEALAKLDRAVSQEAGLTRYFRGIVLAQLPAELGKAEAAVADLAWVLQQQNAYSGDSCHPIRCKAAT